MPLAPKQRSRQEHLTPGVQTLGPPHSWELTHGIPLWSADPCPRPGQQRVFLGLQRHHPPSPALQEALEMEPGAQTLAYFLIVPGRFLPASALHPILVGSPGILGALPTPSSGNHCDFLQHNKIQAPLTGPPSNFIFGGGRKTKSPGPGDLLCGGGRKEESSPLS